MGKRVVTLGDRVRSQREKLGLTQYQVAVRAGVRPEGISRIETGKSPASLVSLHKIAPVLGMSIDELLRDQSSTQSTLTAGPSVKKVETTKKKKTKGKTS